jgi:tRNA threonylcarbamoyladenosine biosynthesis protein TsaB
MSSLLLAIESATAWLSVALLEDERLIGLQEGEGERAHAVALLPAIDALLAEAGVTLERVGALVVSAGPGSFTSLRIGLATAKGIAFERPLATLGVSTLEAMALGALEGEPGPGGEDDEVVALLDARRGEWYAGGWRAAAEPKGLPRPTLAEGLYAPARLAERVARGRCLVSPEGTGWVEAFEAAGGVPGRVVIDRSARPSAVWVGRLGGRRLGRGEGVSAAQLAARYVRRAEAEAQRLGAPVEGEAAAAVGAEADGARAARSRDPAESRRQS